MKNLQTKYNIELVTTPNVSFGGSIIFNFFYV